MSLKTIHVTQWFPDKTNKKSVYSIYEDDNIEDGILKLVAKLEIKDRFYVWNSVYKSILFSIPEYSWKGYNFNPLEATDTSNAIISQPIIYKYNNGLCYFNNINIIFEQDFPNLKDNHYYFIDLKIVNRTHRLQSQQLQEIQ